MPKINIEQPSNRPAQELFQKIKEFFQTDQDFKKLDPKLKVEFSDAKLSGQATGSQFKADIQIVAQGAGSQVNIIVDLPFILTPLKGKIQETIQKKLNKHLA